ncbi:MAG: hypothetical protein JW891_09950 [Candidatus Lokiarchaeota archaeon]|nr:hypothetical protein [Candidatus Lokiarchaeota archaeon]
MKKISFGLDVGLVGSSQSSNNLFLEYLKDASIQRGSMVENAGDEGPFRALMVFDNVPINIRIYVASNIEDLINEDVNKMDGLILVLDVHDMESKNRFSSVELIKFTLAFGFKGFSTLVGVDAKNKSDGKNIDADRRINRTELIQKAKDLELLYCFEIQKPYRDMKNFFDKILKDQIVKFAISNPELLEQSKKYGKELMDKKKSS